MEISETQQSAGQSGTSEHVDTIKSWRRIGVWFVGVLFIAGLFGWMWFYFFSTLSADNNAVDTSGTPGWIVWTSIVVALVAAGKFLPLPKMVSGGMFTIASIIVSLSLANLLSEGINNGLEWVDRGVNHGDWSPAAESVRRVHNGTISVKKGSFGRFLASGEIKLHKESSEECLVVEPDTPFYKTPVYSGSTVIGYLVKESSTDQLIYTHTWNSNARDTILSFTREEKISVETLRLGEGWCHRV